MHDLTITHFAHIYLIVSGLLKYCCALGEINCFYTVRIFLD